MEMDIIFTNLSNVCRLVRKAECEPFFSLIVPNYHGGWFYIIIDHIIQKWCLLRLKLSRDSGNIYRPGSPTLKCLNFSRVWKHSTLFFFTKNASSFYEIPYKKHVDWFTVTIKVIHHSPFIFFYQLFCSLYIYSLCIIMSILIMCMLNTTIRNNKFYRISFHFS